MFLRAALRVTLSKSTFHLRFGRASSAGSRCEVLLSASSRHFIDVPRNELPSPEVEKHLVRSPCKDVKLPDEGICKTVWKGVEKWSDRTAIVCGLTGRSYNYGQLRESCRKFGSALRKAGLEEGDVVGVVLDNTPDYPIVALGAIEAGLVVTTFDPDNKPGEISRQLQDSSPRVIVTSYDRIENVMTATKDAIGQGYKPPIIIITDGRERKDMPEGALDMHQIIESNNDVSNISNTEINLEAPAVVLYSSGTTGTPKGVLLSQRNVVAAMLLQQEPNFMTWKPATDNNQEILPAVFPFFHITGLAMILMLSIISGSKIVTLAPKFDPKLLMEILAKHKASLLFTSPPILQYLGSATGITLAHLTSLRCVISAAAPLREEDAQRFLKKAPPNLRFVQGYGLTETSAIVCWNRKDSVKVASIGPCVSNTVLKVIDHNGYTLGPFEKGEVCVKGPQVMIGYYKNPEKTRKVIDEAGWFHTGDIAYYDSDSDFYIVDRMKDLIKVKGYLVSPTELEELLRSHPEVKDCAVVGAPDDRTGVAVYAFVQVQNDSKPNKKLAKVLKNFVDSKVVEYKQIKEVKFVDEIPKNSIGKILRRVLREQVKKRYLLEKTKNVSE